MGATEDVEIGFNLLVESFCFSVGLRVTGGREGNLIPKDASKCFGKVCHELGP